MDTYNINNEFLSTVSHVEIIMLLYKLHLIKLELKSHIVFETSIFTSDYKVLLDLKEVEKVKGITVAKKLLLKWSNASIKDTQTYELCSSGSSYKDEEYCGDCCPLCNFCHGMPSNSLGYKIRYRGYRSSELSEVLNKWDIQFI